MNPFARTSDRSATGNEVIHGRSRRAASPGTGEQVTQRVVEDRDVTATHVNVDNFARAETDRMIADLQRDAGGINRFAHNRAPASIDKQTVIRMNRDTLYSFAVVDVAAGATLTRTGRRGSVPLGDGGQRGPPHQPRLPRPGHLRLTIEDLGSAYVVVAARTLVDPRDPDDLAAVASLQDQLLLHVAAGPTFTPPTTTPRAWTAPATRSWAWPPT